jgi:hypothetical protein
MNTTRGVCTNFGGCGKADGKIAIDVAPGGEFICPECQLHLSSVASRGLTQRTRVFLGVGGGVALIGFAIVGMTRAFHRGDERNPPDSTVTQPSDSAQYGGDTARTAPAPAPAVPRTTDSTRRAEGSKAPQVPKTSGGARLATSTSAVSPRPVSPPDTVVGQSKPPAVNANPVAGVPAAAPATAPVPATQPASSEPVKEPTRVSAILARRTEIAARPDSSICEEDARVGDRVDMHLAAALTLSDGSLVPEGTTMVGRISGKTSNPGQPPLIQLEATSLTLNGKAVPIETNPFSFYMQRPSAMGNVAKGAIIGGVAGAVVGLVLTKNVAVAAGIGAAAGGTIGKVTSASQACVSPKDSRFVFVVVKDVVMQ